MSTDEQSQWIVPTTGAKTLPVVEILTGRGFVTGKSGSGKSNTASVIAEELLESNYNLLVVDPEGEYYGLKERYEILHVGNDELCDVQVTPDHAGKIAEIALERNMPVIVDVSDFLDAEEARELIANVVRELFQKEKDLRKPFLLMIEEMQEYLPQQGGNDELAELLERVAKRGRKRGLGMLGMSQRPSSVDKDFITQCDWMVWHRLTWQNDIDVVRNVLGSEIADEVEDLDTGEGYLMTDWDERVERVQFKRKRTHDAGATPGLESYERPDLKDVSADLINEIQQGTVPQQGDHPAPELSPEEQADLNQAVEQVEIEGVPESVDGADTAAAPTNGTTAGGEAGQGTAGAPDAVGDPVAGVDRSPGGSAPADDVDLESMSSEELHEYARAVRKRNRLLEDEVTELRTILQSVERGDVPQSGNDPQPTGPEHEAAPFAGPTGGSGTGETNAGGSRGGGTRAGGSRARGTDSGGGRPDLSRPEPPEPPIERSGVAGNLVEFVEMSGYLTRSLVYRCRLLAYRLRNRGREDPERPTDA